jgi:O-6-methylguanine DNA methyltransferase
MKDHIAADLARLRVAAPAGMTPAVLTRVGLAHRYVRRDSPIGPVYVAVSNEGVSRVDVAPDDAVFERRFEERFGRPAVPAGDLPQALIRSIDRAIEAGRPGDLSLDLTGLTEFQRRVLSKAAEIPRAEVRPYGWVAREIGSPGAVRAVGSALAANPVPIVVPCHRVVRSDGRFGDYSLGDPANKRRLLAAEGLDAASHEALALRGIRFLGSDTTHIFCLPSCRHARRITAAHRMEFRSEASARAAGCRPCSQCRPVAA